MSVVGKNLARMAVEGLPTGQNLFQGLEIVVSVPLHPKKKRQRGFNQAEIIAQETARLLELEYVKDALVKDRNTPPQTSMTADERRRNVRGVFSLKKREEVEGRRVLLVDDVYTTGATLRECSQVLIRGGAREVRALTLARA